MTAGEAARLGLEKWNKSPGEPPISAGLQLDSSVGRPTNEAPS